MRAQINQILYSDAQPVAHVLVKSLFLLAVGIVVTIATATVAGIGTCRLQGDT